MKFFKQLLPLVLLLAAQCLYAQNRTVSGKVFDMEEQPLGGVAVLISNTSTGGLTADDGSFSFQIEEAGDIVLDISCLGYKTQRVTVQATQANVNVYLEEDSFVLDEMVVVGYGVQKKVNLTGAVAVVESKDLENRASQNLTNMLQGTVPGLNVTTSSGIPGSSADINIRGYASINGGDPLVLIDGAIGNLDSVNSNDVESISVIKDASAAAVYGARAAFGVILVTTKTGQEGNKARVQLTARYGWQAPTTSTDFETTGYWSVYTVNKFWYAYNGANYVDYTDNDMMQLLARVNDKTENPDRPWTIEEVRNGKNQWVYYGNYDWWHMLYQDKRPTQQYNISLSGGTKGVKYMVSGGYDRQDGLLKTNTDIYQKYNLRSKIDFDIAKWATFSNNTSFYSSNYSFQGNGSIEDTLAYSARHALACFPMQNPDGTWLYSTPYLNYKVANGRHIMVNEGTHRNVNRTSDFQNTSRLVIKFFPTLNLTADFTYRQYQTRNTHRTQPFYYREYPDSDIESYATGAGLNELSEAVNTQQYYSTNVYLSYDETYGKGHHLSATGGFNYEKKYYKNVSASGQNLISTVLDDFNLVGQNDDGEVITSVDGSQADYVLMGFFARINYDYKGKYLFEASGRYDGSSRFAKGHRWGFFPSASAGWRISEEPFFEPARDVVDNLKLRFSFGSLGNQNVSSYYTYLRLISVTDFEAFSFGEGSSMAKYATISAPVAGDLTWEKTNQYDLGLDYTMLQNRFTLTGDVYIRNTIGMLTDGIDLPAVYGADSPDMNAADLSTRGYEIAVNWRDQFMLGGHPFEYSVGASVSDYESIITKYANDNNLITNYYVGMHVGEIWGFKTDGLLKDQAAVDEYLATTDVSYINNVGGWQPGDLKYVDLNGDGVIGIGQSTTADPGDRTILGNSLPSLSYGFNASVRYFNFDVSVFFQGTGNHYWYPTGQAMNFWGCYSYPYCSFLQENFLDKCWSTDNPDAYFPRPVAYASSSGSLKYVNDRYLQNLRYLRLKNLTVGYTVPPKATKKAHIDQIRVYFTGENLCYWSPLKKNTKYIDPEAAFDRDDANNNAYYPWAKTYMFGIDITF
ncbi:MAG: TonB-dependent receptor [Bacteroidales bacterium]|nr:TonB-dependent receptor [Bacteroidales bacterium]